MTDLQPWDKFVLIQKTKYNQSGIKVNWKIIIDDEHHVTRLLFQETNGIIDWVSNLSFPTVEVKYTDPIDKTEKSVEICVGWWSTWCSAKEEIISAYKATCDKYPEYMHEIDGWSLGGAMTKLAGFSFYVATGEKLHANTFGSPKVEKDKNSKAKLLYCFASFNEFDNYNDIVPRLPPCGDYVAENKIMLDDSKVVWYKIAWPWKYHKKYYDKKIYDKADWFGKEIEE